MSSSGNGIPEDKPVDPRLVEGQRQLVETIKAEAREQEAQREAESNVVKLTDNIMAGTPAAAQLERQRQTAAKLDDIIVARLNAGAEALEKMVCHELRQGSAGDIGKAHGMMDQARCLRITIGFIKAG